MTAADNPINHHLYIFCVTLALLSLTAYGGRDECRLSQDWSGAAASPNRTSLTHSVISCKPCNYNGKYEVHILQVYKWTKLPLEVNVTAGRDTVLYLILINVRPTHWMLRIPRRVTIGEVRVLSYSNPKKETYLYNKIILESGEYLNAFVARQHYYMFPRPGTTLGEDLTEMVEYVNKEFGFITSYTGIEETSGWNLTVGTCDRNGLSIDGVRNPKRQPRKIIDGKDRKWCDLSLQHNATGTPLDFKDFTHYNCSPCNTDKVHETHVLNMIGPIVDWSSDVVVEVYTERQSSEISLVLINRDATNWIIRLGTYWWIDVVEIHLLTANTSGSSVTLETAGDYNPYIIETNGFISGWDDFSQIENYCYEHFGFLSSYNGIERARKWILNVGMCLPPYKKPDTAANSRTGTGFPNHFIPVIVFPIVLFLLLFYVPMIIERRLKNSKKRRKPPPVMTLDVLRRQMGTVVNEVEANSPGAGGGEAVASQWEAEVHPPPTGFREPRPYFTNNDYGSHWNMGQEQPTNNADNFMTARGIFPSENIHGTQWAMDPEAFAINSDTAGNPERSYQADTVCSEDLEPPSYHTLQTVHTPQEATATNNDHLDINVEEEPPPSYDAALQHIAAAQILSDGENWEGEVYI